MKTVLARLLVLLALFAPVAAFGLGNPVTTNGGSPVTTSAGSFIAPTTRSTGGATYQITCLGDSLTTTVGSVAVTVPYCLGTVNQLSTSRSITAGYTIIGMVGYSWNYNYGNPYPDATSTINLAAPFWADTQYRPGLTNILVMWAGTNGMFVSLGNHSAATEYADFQTNYNARIATGLWTDAATIIITALPRQDDASFDTKRATYNASLISWCGIHGCVIADAGGDATIGCNGCEDNTTYYQTDKIHLKNAGQAIVTGLVYAKIADATVQRRIFARAAPPSNDNFDWSFRIASHG